MVRTYRKTRLCDEDGFSVNTSTLPVGISVHQQLKQVEMIVKLF